MSATMPDEHDALAFVERAIGQRPVSASRFTTGLKHYVYDCELADGQGLVARLSRPEHRSVQADAARLSDVLRPRGVPLPEILYRGLDDTPPGLLLRRLPGRDLAHEINATTEPQRRAIATEVARWQDMAATLPTAGRYGYAADPAAAPHADWGGVLQGMLDRAQRNTAISRNVDSRVLDELGMLVASRRDSLQAVAATPFLHDATTKNVIVDGGRVTGLVDVDDLCFGDRRWTAALTLAALILMGGPRDYAANLLAAGGGQPDEDFALYTALFAVDLLSEAGRHFNRDRPIVLADEGALQQAVLVAMDGARGRQKDWLVRLCA